MPPFNLEGGRVGHANFSKIDEGVDVFDLKPMLAAARAQLETADEMIAQAAFNQEVTRKATHTPAPGRFKA